MTRPTTPMAYNGSGWSNGIAAQLSLPSISTSSLLRRGTPSGAGGAFRPCRCPPYDAVEQIGRDRAVGGRWDGLARLRQLRVAGLVERRPGAAHLSHPGVEVASQHRLGDEPHLGKSVAAEIC